MTSQTFSRQHRQHLRHPRHSAPVRRVGAAIVAISATLSIFTLNAPGASAIIKGQTVTQGTYPWMVALKDVAGQFCGGSIIQADLILTAAHCVNDTSAAAIRVQAGTVYLNDFWSQTRTVKQIRVHPQYSTTNDRNDVAVLILSTPLNLNTRVQPIRTADKVAQASLIDAQSPAVVMGWGATSDLLADAPNQLRAADVKIVGDAGCNWLWGGGIDALSMLCANSTVKADACSGDSGGPLVVTDPTTHIWYQTGVVSFGDTCDAAETPGVYADVANLAPFINSRGAGGTIR